MPTEIYPIPKQEKLFQKLYTIPNDTDTEIYDDLYKELKEAIAALNPSETLCLRIFFMALMVMLPPEPLPAAQVPKWKKLGKPLPSKIGNALFKNQC
jgi:hypothetical protein